MSKSNKNTDNTKKQYLFGAFTTLDAHCIISAGDINATKMCYVRERYNTLGHDVRIIIICRFGGLWLGHGTCMRTAVGTQSRVKQGSANKYHIPGHTLHTHGIVVIWIHGRFGPASNRTGRERDRSPCLIREKKESSRCRNGEQAKHTFWRFSYHHLRRQCCNSILEPEYHRMQRKLTLFGLIINKFRRFDNFFVGRTTSRTPEILWGYSKRTYTNQTNGVLVVALAEAAGSFLAGIAK